MKNLLLILLLATAPAIHVGCSTPATRNQTVATLKAVGHTAEAAVSLSAQLYADGKITNDQAWAVFEFYNKRYLPAFRLAVSAAKLAGAMWRHSACSQPGRLRLAKRPIIA